MDKNKFIIEPTTSKVEPFFIRSGYATIDCNYERAYDTVCDKTQNYDRTFNKPLKGSEFVYLPNYPSKVLTYDEFLSFGKDKYYWDSLDQRLYKFYVYSQEEINADEGKIQKPFIKQKQVVKGVEGNPVDTVNVRDEFDKLHGYYYEVQLEFPTSTYETIYERPDLAVVNPSEDVLYYNATENKFYKYVSNYTKNINTLYYNINEEQVHVRRFLYEQQSWSDVHDALILAGDPNELLIIEDDINTEYINVDDIDKEIYYIDKTTNTLYLLDYGQYFVDIMYTGTIYERPFEWYRNLQTVYADINDNTKVITKDIYYVHGHPRKIKEPLEDRYYYDTKAHKYYEYINGDWNEVAQGNLIIPQKFFPHTHGSIQKAVTLYYYRIIDCYTKKEVNRLMPVIPGYISAFENDKHYIYQHQDISGKQDNLTVEQLNSLDSGVTDLKVDNWNRQVELANLKQDGFTPTQQEAADSTITAALVYKYDNLANTSNSKANKSSTLKGYGITDAYSDEEIIIEIEKLIERLNNA